MEKISKPICSMCHKVIRTRHVFVKNEQVYLKKSTENIDFTGSENEEWFPMNFQWIPMVQLSRKLNH